MPIRYMKKLAATDSTGVMGRDTRMDRAIVPMSCEEASKLLKEAQIVRDDALKNLNAMRDGPSYKGRKLAIAQANYNDAIKNLGAAKLQQQKICPLSVIRQAI